MIKTIGIIGYGNMGSVISQQLKAHYEVIVFDKDRTKTAVRGTAKSANSIKDLANKAGLLILAVKPQDFDHLLREIRGFVKDKLIISIAAGIGTGHIEHVLGQARVIRVMPNIGAKIGESVTCLSKGRFASEEDLAVAQELFYFLGMTKVIDEEMMNAATAISGSGPGYIFDFMEANSIEPDNIAEHTRHDITLRLEKAAESLGFNHEDAVFLAVNTTSSSINLARRTRISLAELKRQVVSKGGTTEAGLAALNKTGSWEEAAKAALKRAEELSKN